VKNDYYNTEVKKDNTDDLPVGDYTGKIVSVNLKTFSTGGVGVIWKILTTTPNHIDSYVTIINSLEKGRMWVLKRNLTAIGIVFDKTEDTPEFHELETLLSTLPDTLVEFDIRVNSKGYRNTTIKGLHRLPNNE
jgi:hypothetical protein